MSRLRVFLADDHVLVRAGIRALLESSAIEVVGEAASGREALRGIEDRRPDVAVLDIAMQEGSGFEVAEVVRRRWPQVKVLMLSAFADLESLQRALRTGAHGYLPKFAAGSELIEAIRSVHAGGRYVARSLAVVLAGGEAPAWNPLASLSRREREVLQLIVEGRSAKDIAAVLHVSPRSVETYRVRLYDKLGVKDQRELIIFAVKHGIVPVS